MASSPVIMEAAEQNEFFRQNKTIMPRSIASRMLIRSQRLDQNLADHLRALQERALRALGDGKAELPDAN
jgi:hypothetical protein